MHPVILTQLLLTGGLRQEYALTVIAGSNDKPILKKNPLYGGPVPVKQL